MVGGSKNRSLEIEGAGRGRAGTFHDVEVNDGGFDAGVAEKRLDGAEIGYRLE
jgi:hypothetical protein